MNVIKYQYFKKKIGSRLITVGDHCFCVAGMFFLKHTYIWKMRNKRRTKDFISICKYYWWDMYHACIYRTTNKWVNPNWYVVIILTQFKEIGNFNKDFKITLSKVNLFIDSWYEQ